ncbi:MAG: NADPH-dependent F420 reductase [Solirubrobacterales bacterium]|nr:NADPH-dependent F420 reductase [Solirubrobacterales bacterium]HMT06247.1 NADPH-dependent F420 reductase [Solirubrobacterales bacterium]
MSENTEAPVIPVIGGTGALGSGLARRWAAGGARVIIGSRDAGRAAEVAAKVAGEAGGTVEGMSNADAAQAADIVFLTIPFRNQSEYLTNLKGVLTPGQILVDCSVPLAATISGKATRTIGIWQGSAAQQAQEMVPEGVTVVSALHTVSAPGLSDLGHELDEDVPVCGDRKADKARVAGLISRIDGLRPVNAGALEMSRIVEQLTALMISVNIRYKTHAGLKFTNLPEGETF